MTGIPFVNDIDLRGNELLNARVPRINGLPTATADMNGWLVYNTQDDRYYLASGAAWHAVPRNLSTLEGVTAASLRDRTNHTGQQDSTTISDFRAAVNASRLNELLAPNAPLAMGSQKITGLANGTASTDAVTKSQLDAVDAKASAAAVGIAIKSPVRAVAKTAITLSGLAQNPDGVTLAANDRVLVAGQADPIQNGIYVAASGAWTRSTDADGANELASGTLVSVREGVTESDSLWGLVSDSATGAVAPGTTAQNWSRAIAGSSGEVIVAGNGISKTGATVSVVAKPSGGVVVDGTGVAVDATVSRRAEGSVPSGATSATITHNLGNRWANVDFYETATGLRVVPTWTPVGPNSGTAEFKTAPTANQYTWSART